MIPVDPSRQGYEEDAAAVAAELALVPGAYGEALAVLGIRVIACRDNVVDHLPHLAGVDVRGWPANSSWRDIPGVYSPQDRCVVVATAGASGEPRRVPRIGERHGSISLAVHETFHGFDYSAGHRRSKADAFRAAWRADRALLGNAYYTNEQAGHEESYAESAARAFGLDDRFRSAWPRLAGFWRDTPPPDVSGLQADAGAEPEGSEEAPVIGIGRISAEGAFVLDLRAEGPGGLVGHGLLVIGPDHEHYGAIAGRLGIGADALARDAIDPEATFAVPPLSD